MGGDRAPHEIVRGAIAARDELGIEVLLVGPDDGTLGDTKGIPVLHASEVIAMDDDPARAVRTKKDSTLVRCAESVRDGQACAMVSAGNTGATMASALLRMGRISGVSRPAIATPLPVLGANPSILIDAGANPECTADWLLQFAQMSSAYVTARYGRANPTVALLSIGEEPTKGNALVKDAHELFRGNASINFIGNVEGRDLLAGRADIIVTDGFTGNVALKSLEGAVGAFNAILRSAINSSMSARMAGLLLRGPLTPYARSVDPDETGGAMLLGVEGVCIISHGSSSARAIKNAIAAANVMVTQNLVERIRVAVAPVEPPPQ
jgi:glycerol-3-phosphate acyltransferase PlsX